jgi:hypothetical protein
MHEVKVGRPYWLPVRGLQAVHFYLEEGAGRVPLSALSAQAGMS